MRLIDETVLLLQRAGSLPTEIVTLVMRRLLGAQFRLMSRPPPITVPDIEVVDEFEIFASDIAPGY